MRLIGLLILCSFSLAGCGSDNGGNSSNKGSAGDQGSSGGTTNGSQQPPKDWFCEGVDDPPFVTLVVREAEIDGLCPLEVTVSDVSPKPDVSCTVMADTTTCECVLKLEAGKYSFSVEHADGRTGHAELDYTNPPACGDTRVQVNLEGPLRTETCELLCDSYEDCPPTSIGPICIGGCCGTD